MAPPVTNPRQRIIDYGEVFILSKNIVQETALMFRTADDRPVVLSEWSPLNGMLLKHRDFSYEHLLEDSRVASLPLLATWGKMSSFPPPSASFPRSPI